MKLVAIADLFIPEAYMTDGLNIIERRGVIVQSVMWDIDDINQLQEINLMVEKNGSDIVEPGEMIYEACKDADIIVTHFCTISQKLIDYCSKLKVICVLRGGTENINVDYATHKDILIINTPGRTANAVADFTVGMILAETRNIARSHSNLKNFRWIRDYANAGLVPNMEDRVIGLVGLGQIGLGVAKRLNAFGAKLIAFDPYVSDDELKDFEIELVSLENLLETSDVVSIHARLNSETKLMIGEAELSIMKPTSYLINTARSGLIDESALFHALKEKKIMGAAIDVFEEEPIPENYALATLDNVTLTPHLAGGTIDTMTGSPKLLSKNLIKLFDGQIPYGSVNHEKINFDSVTFKL